MNSVSRAYSAFSNRTRYAALATDSAASTTRSALAYSYKIMILSVLCTIWNGYGI